ALPFERSERRAHVCRRRPADAADLDRADGEERRLARDEIEDGRRAERGARDEERAASRYERRQPREVRRAQPPTLRKRDDRHPAHFAAPWRAPTTPAVRDRRGARPRAG